MEMEQGAREQRITLSDALWGVAFVQLLLNESLERRQVFFNHAPDQVELEIEVCMSKDVSEAANRAPLDVWMTASQLSRQVSAGIGQDFQTTQDCILCPGIFFEQAPGGAAVYEYVLLNQSDALIDQLQIDAVIPHRATASRRIRSRVRFRAALSTMSTLRPRSISRSHLRSSSTPKYAKPRASVVISTRMSISLEAMASPRATEPKTRTFLASCLAAIRKISFRNVRKFSRVGFSVATTRSFILVLSRQS